MARSWNGKRRHLARRGWQPLWADKVMALQTMFGSDAIRAAAAVANAGARFQRDGRRHDGSRARRLINPAIKQRGFAFALDSMKARLRTIPVVVPALLPC